MGLLELYHSLETWQKYSTGGIEKRE